MRNKAAQLIAQKRCFYVVQNHYVSYKNYNLTLMTENYIQTGLVVWKADSAIHWLRFIVRDFLGFFLIRRLKILLGLQL